MPFEKGQSGNIDGKPKGATNKTTKALKEWVTAFIEDNKEQIISDWQTLEPKDRIMLFEKLLRYVLPTQASIKAEVEEVSQQQTLIITGKKFAQIAQNETLSGNIQS